MSTVKFLGKYYLHDRIGANQAAQLFRAMEIGSSGFERMVRIYRFKDDFIKDESKRNSITESFQYIQELRNPNLVALLDLAQIREDWILVREYVHGITLRNFLLRLAQNKQSLSLEESLYIGRELFRALKAVELYGESNGFVIVHGHIHPENIFISYEGEIKLNGLGVAEFFEAPELQTQPFVAPEQIEGKALDPRADTYGVGAVLVELLSGKPPFFGATFDQINTKIRTGLNMGAVEDRGIPRDVGKFICKAMEIRRDWRYLSPVEAEEALSALLPRTKLEEQKQILGGRAQALFAQDLQKERLKVLEEHKVVAKLLGSELPPSDEIFARKKASEGLHSLAPSSAAPLPADVEDSQQIKSGNLNTLLSMNVEDSQQLQSGNLMSLFSDSVAGPAPRSFDLVGHSDEADASLAFLKPVSTSTSKIRAKKEETPSLSPSAPELLYNNDPAQMAMVKTVSPPAPAEPPPEMAFVHTNDLSSMLGNSSATKSTFSEPAHSSSTSAKSKTSKHAVPEPPKSSQSGKTEAASSPEIAFVHTNDLSSMLGSSSAKKSSLSESHAQLPEKTKAKTAKHTVPSVPEPPKETEEADHASPSPTMSSVGLRTSSESRTAWQKKLEELGTKPSGANTDKMVKVVIFIILLIGVVFAVANLLAS